MVLEPETARFDRLAPPRRSRKRAQHAASPANRQRIAGREAKRAAAQRDAATSLLVVEPLRWALALRPRWIALEQVPPVLPLWEAIADVLRVAGYSTWTGVLSAERYGCAQTRQRAILIASLDRIVSEPAATHQRYIAPRRRGPERYRDAPAPTLVVGNGTGELAGGSNSRAARATDEPEPMTLFPPPEPQRIVASEDAHLLPWVTMAECLGFGMTMRPSVSLLAKVGGTGGHRPLEGGSGARATLDRAREDGHWEDGPAPAPTVTSGGTSAGGGVEVFAGHEARQRAADAARWVQRSNYSDSGSGTAEERGRTERPLDAPSVAITSKGFQWQRQEDDDGRVPTGRDVPALLRGDLPDAELRRDDAGQHAGPGALPEVRADGGPDEAGHVGGDAYGHGGARSDSWAPGSVAPQFVANDRKNATVRDIDEPAPTITAGHSHGERRWELRAGTNANDCGRPLDSPAPTIRYGSRLNDVSWVLRSAQSVAGQGRAERSVDDPSLTVIGRFDLCEWTSERPATSVNCDPRIAEPGRHDPEQNGSQYGPQTVRVTVEEAAALQSFPNGWPWHAAGTKTAAFRAVGNAICPLLALHILKAVT